MYLKGDFERGWCACTISCFWFASLLDVESNCPTSQFDGCVKQGHSDTECTGIVVFLLYSDVILAVIWCISERFQNLGPSGHATVSKA